MGKKSENGWNHEKNTCEICIKIVANFFLENSEIGSDSKTLTSTTREQVELVFFNSEPVELGNTLYFFTIFFLYLIFFSVK